MAKVKSWQVSASFWNKVKPLIPSSQPDPNKIYQDQPGAGRKPMPAGKIFDGIVDVLPTGGQWKALPKERFASSSVIDTHFLRWAESGFWLLFGQLNWLNMMKWRLSPGNGKASTEPL